MLGEGDSPPRPTAESGTLMQRAFATSALLGACSWGTGPRAPLPGPALLVKQAKMDSKNQSGEWSMLGLRCVVGKGPWLAWCGGS